MLVKIKGWIKSLFKKNNSQALSANKKTAEKQPSKQITVYKCLHCGKYLSDATYSRNKDDYCYVLCRSCSFVMKKFNDAEEIVAAENDLDVIAEAYELFESRSGSYAYTKDGDKLSCSSLAKTVETDS